MPQVCPTCQIALDPTHAPVARVVAAKVVAYCSIRCAEQSGKKQNEGAKKPAKAESEEAKPLKKEVGNQRASKAPLGDSEKPVKVSAPSKEEGLDEETKRKMTSNARRLSSGRRKRVLWTCGAISLGGMTIAAIPWISPGSSSPVNAANTKQEEPSIEKVSPTLKQGSPEPAIKAKPLSATSLRNLAIAELETHLDSESNRYRRIAGIALARISHSKAAETLEALLATEASDLARIDIAYGLSLAGKEKGTKYLLAELKSKRRDVRIDAARRLAQLHNSAGEKALLQMLNIRSHRLGAASVLALLGNAKGIETLHKEFNSAKSSEETKMRAAVGLGRSGDNSAQETLREILKDGRFVVDAAGALAALGDSTAIVALEAQLDLTALRVVAAQSLVAMGHSVKLDRLASAMMISNVEGRIAASEALLVLTAKLGKEKEPPK